MCLVILLELAVNLLFGVGFVGWFALRVLITVVV